MKLSALWKRSASQTATCAKAIAWLYPQPLDAEAAYIAGQAITRNAMSQIPTVRMPEPSSLAHRTKLADWTDCRLNLRVYLSPERCWENFRKRFLTTRPF